MRRMMMTLTAALALATVPAFAGEWHAGPTNLCTDCHTMHFSMQHDWNGNSPVSTVPIAGGNWLGTTGPNSFLLKEPANQLCLACHDGQTFAPDVLETNFNAGPAGGRSAGALNEVGAAGVYNEYNGHTLGSTDVPPGYNPAAVGLAVTFYNNAGGLECTSCHTQHGGTTAYRNLGPRNANFQPTYAITTGANTTVDVLINLASYTANSGVAATFNPYYDAASVSFNRTDATVGLTKTSNRIDTHCGACHGNFHGGFGDTEIAPGMPSTALDGFIRHPTAQVQIGAAGGQGFGGHSNLARYVGNTAKVRVYADDHTTYVDAVPGCISCHKAHGNRNPFGLVFLGRQGAAATGYNASYPEEGNFDPTTPYMQGYRNLCGQCHSQGN